MTGEKTKETQCPNQSPAAYPEPDPNLNESVQSILHKTITVWNLLESMDVCS